MPIILLTGILVSINADLYNFIYHLYTYFYLFQSVVYYFFYYITYNKLFNLFLVPHTLHFLFFTWHRQMGLSLVIRWHPDMFAVLISAICSIHQWNPGEHLPPHFLNLPGGQDSSQNIPEKTRCSFWVNQLYKFKIINKLQYVHTFCFIALFISLWWILLLWCSRVINLKVCFWSELLYCNSSPLLMNYLNNFVTNPCNERFKSLSLISTERFYEK